MRDGLGLIENVSRPDPTNAQPFVGISLNGACFCGADASRAAVDHALRLNPGDYYAQARGWLGSVNRPTPDPMPWVTQYEMLIAFHEGRFREAGIGLAPFAYQAWQMMYAIAAHGHLGEADQAQAIVARFAAQGRVRDYLSAAAREPYLHPEPRNHLLAGLKPALGQGQVRQFRLKIRHCARTAPPFAIPLPHRRSHRL